LLFSSLLGSALSFLVPFVFVASEMVLYYLQDASEKAKTNRFAGPEDEI
jgi:hypothetical protein